MPANVVVVGCDAASPHLIERWIEEGKLPNLAAAFRSGYRGRIQSVPGFYIGSTWPSFTTGLDPSEHGFHRIIQLRNGTYDFFRPLGEPGGMAGVPFWRTASDAGRKVAILDVPLTALEPDLNGIQVVEWGGHDSVFGFRTQPAALADEILELAGRYPLPPNCDAARDTPADFDGFVTALESAVEKKIAITLDILERDHWDLLMQVFTESHCVGHQCWHLHDPDHPAHDPAHRAAVGDPLERVYRALDRGVGDILAAAGEAVVLLVAAHGMSYFRGANMLLAEILVRLGVTERASSDPVGRPRALAAKAWRALPRRVRTTLRPPKPTVGPGSLPGGRMPTFRFDTASACFPLANGMPVSGIRLNVVGREPSGVVAPGAPAERFVASLRERLLSIVDERTGRPLIREVTPTSELFAGSRLDALPDILVTWDDRLPTGSLAHGNGRGATLRAASPEIGIVEATNSYVRTGDHIPDGWFTFIGPGVRAERAAQPVSVMDFHPTLCRLLGLDEGSAQHRALEVFR